MATQVPHETQEACIAALHEEIGRTKAILANLKSAPGRESATPSRPDPAEPDDDEPEGHDRAGRMACRDPEYM